MGGMGVLTVVSIYFVCTLEHFGGMINGGTLVRYRDLVSVMKM